MTPKVGLKIAISAAESVIPKKGRIFPRKVNGGWEHEGCRAKRYFGLVPCVAPKVVSRSVMRPVRIAKKIKKAL